MKNWMIALLFLPALALAQEKHTDKELKRDIERHRQMAAAHEAAARCLAGGQKPEDCQKALQAACKGIAIGKYCGMKHEH